jgi:hypothetical protein
MFQRPLHRHCTRMFWASLTGTSTLGVWQPDRHRVNSRAYLSRRAQLAAKHRHILRPVRDWLATRKERTTIRGLCSHER